MNDRSICRAPVFGGSSALGCALLTVFVYVPLIAFLSAFAAFGGAKCLLRKTLYRMNNCRQGNSDPTIVLSADFGLWLDDNPVIADAIDWQLPPGLEVRKYHEWSSKERRELTDTCHRILNGSGTNLSEAPALASTPGPTENARTLLTRDDAWRYFLGYVAQSIVVQVRGLVGWSLESYNAAALTQLFSSKSLYWQMYESWYGIESGEHGGVTPGDPVRVHGFLLVAGLIRPVRRATIEALIEWCRDHLVHFLGGSDAANVYNQWQYYGEPPVERMIAGTPRLDDPGGGNRHRTKGCWGTTGFLKAVLRTVNIPVDCTTPNCGGHLTPRFMGEELYLTHGDDPYNALARGVPLMPASAMLIDFATFSAWFGAGEPTSCTNMGRLEEDFALAQLPTYLLWLHCQDIAAGRSHEASRVFQVFNQRYTVAQLESLNLWTNIEAKIAGLGGCGNVTFP